MNKKYKNETSEESAEFRRYIGTAQRKRIELGSSGGSLVTVEIIRDQVNLGVL